jgi:hypothetical protein
MKGRILVLGLALAAALGLGAAGVSCNFADAVTCDPDELNLEAGTRGNFGSDEAGRKINAFFDATIAVQAKAHTLMTTVTGACTNIGLALGLTAAQMQPTAASPSDAQRIDAACTPVAQAIRETVQAALPSGFALSLQYTPPVCEADFDVYASCAGACDATVTPGELTVDCEPGTIGIGECGASCSGQCWVQASATCAGSCDAQCTGSCSGSCYGTCAGTCSYTDPGTGECAGTCTGTCTGSCSATCTGSCSGYCVAEVDGGCTGECHGGCDAWFTPPTCEVYARPPEVDVDCHASCEARASANLSCTRGSLTVNYGQLGGNAAAQERLQTLITVLRTEYPAVLQASVEAGEAVVALVGSFFDSLSAFGDTVGAALDAAACTIVALSVQVEVSATFSASLSATTSISASVTAEGSASVGP